MRPDSDEFHNVVDGKASKKVLSICALAESAMLQRFGHDEAANAVLGPYILGSQ